MKNYKINIHNPIGRERTFDIDSSIRFEINGNIFKIKIDKQLQGISITKTGRGTLRGKVDRIQIIPETSNQFIIK